MILPIENHDSRHVYHQFTIRSENRDSIAKHLQDNDISSAIYYPVPLHKQAVFAHLNASDDLRVSEKCAEEVLSLPMFPELTEREILQICDVINHAP